MNLPRAILALPAAILLLSCTPVELYPGARTVREGKSDPPAECEDRGIVVVTEWSDEDADHALRNGASAKGADYVRLDSIERRGRRVTYTGVAFKCSVSRVEPGPQTAPAVPSSP